MRVDSERFPVELDDVDRQILEHLQVDAGLTNVDLAERVGLSPSACLRRVQRLESSGVVAGRVLLIDPVAIGRPLQVFVEITLESQSEAYLDGFESAVQTVPEVMSCHLLAGDFDYLLHLTVENTADFERIHRSHLSGLPGVARMRSSFALRTVFSTTRHDLSRT